MTSSSGASPGALTLIAEDPALGLNPLAFFGRSAATQKGRLLEAVTRVVAEKGYTQAKVSDIVTAAGVSRTTFYEHFAGKDECLLEANRVASSMLAEYVANATIAASGQGWQAAIDAGVRTYLTMIRDQPLIARTHMVELLAAGRPALQARSEAVSRFADLVTEIVRTIQPDADLPDRAGVLLVLAGLDTLVSHTVEQERFDLLEGLADAAVAALGNLIRPPA